MTQCPRTDCHGALLPDSTDPSGPPSELLRCDFCARVFSMVLGLLCEIRPQVGTKLDYEPTNKRAASHHRRNNV